MRTPENRSIAKTIRVRVVADPPELGNRQIHAGAESMATMRIDRWRVDAARSIAQRGRAEFSSTALGCLLTPDAGVSLHSRQVTAAASPMQPDRCIRAFGRRFLARISKE
jgi:hypothetical protein